MKPDRLRELLAIGYNGQVPFAEFVRMVEKALTDEDDRLRAALYKIGVDHWQSKKELSAFARAVLAE